jgi:Protein of unknown function (DUF742)
MREDDGYRDRAVRPYVVTAGRARPSRNIIRPETLLVATDPGRPLPVSASREERALLRMCRRLLSLAKAAAHLDLPVSVVAVVASDLVDGGRLAARSGTPVAAGIDRKILEEVRNGLRRLN